MEDVPGLPVFGQTLSAESLDGAGVGLCGEQDDRFSELFVRAACDGESACEVGSQPVFHFLDLNLDAAGINHIVFPSEYAEAGGCCIVLPAVGPKLGSVVGYQSAGAYCRSIDDKASVAVESCFHSVERPVPVAGIRTVQPSEGDVRERLCHAVGAPYGVGEVVQGFRQPFVY